MPGKYADRRLLVLPFFRRFPGCDNTLCCCQDIWATHLWKRLVWICLLDSDGVGLSSVQGTEGAKEETWVDVTDNSRKRENGTECILCMECVKNCPKNAL